MAVAICHAGQVIADYPVCALLFADSSLVAGWQLGWVAQKMVEQKYQLAFGPVFCLGYLTVVIDIGEQKLFQLGQLFPALC